MPGDNHQDHAIGSTVAGRHPAPSTHPLPPSLAPTKPNPKLLSLVLQAVIMGIIISLFFVFIGIAAIIFIHLCIAGGALHRRHRRHRRHRQPTQDEFSSGFSTEELKALPRIKVNELYSWDACAICLDNVLEGDWCRILPACNHLFHSECVDKWLFKVPACPICRAVVRLKLDDRKRQVERVNTCGQL